MVSIGCVSPDQHYDRIFGPHTANPLEVLVAVTSSGRGIVGVVDGSPPIGVESDDEAATRLEFLRDIGYRT